MSLATFLVLVFVLFIALWSFAILVLAGESHRQFDKPIGGHFKAHPDDLAVETKTVKELHQIRNKVLKSKSFKLGFAISREFADNLSQDIETDTLFSSVQNADFDAEWAIAPNTDINRRVLFLHGGAFVIGSAGGHRKFSDALSRACNAAVLSVNYRMLPEYSRKVGISDAQRAYQWIIQNSPDTQKPCDFLLVAGDSAGGNLALMLASWSKHNSQRRPNGVLGFSPSLDSTASSPSFQTNRKTDKILGPSIGKLCLLPRPVLIWIATLLLRSNPSNPEVSPLFYKLADLPPTLIHVSSSEMLLGDAIRYTNKAIQAGSRVTLQIWENQIHDWHLFNMGSGSANNAWKEVRKFVEGLD